MDISIPLLLGLLIAVPLVFLISAVFVRLAVKLAMKFDVPFGQACLVTLVVCVINFVISLLATLATTGRHLPTLATSLLSIIVNFFVSSVIYGGMIKDPNTSQPIGFEKGMLVALVLLAIGIVIGLIIFVPVTLLSH